MTVGGKFFPRKGIFCHQVTIYPKLAPTQKWRDFSFQITLFHKVETTFRCIPRRSSFHPPAAPNATTFALRFSHLSLKVIVCVLCVVCAEGKFCIYIYIYVILCGKMHSSLCSFLFDLFMHAVQHQYNEPIKRSTPHIKAVKQNI